MFTYFILFTLRDEELPLILVLLSHRLFSRLQRRTYVHVHVHIPRVCTYLHVCTSIHRLRRQIGIEAVVPKWAIRCGSLEGSLAPSLVHGALQ